MLLRCVEKALMSGKWSSYDSINSKFIQDYFWFQISSDIDINFEIPI